MWISRMVNSLCDLGQLPPCSGPCPHWQWEGLGFLRARECYYLKFPSKFLMKNPTLERLWQQRATASPAESLHSCVTWERPHPPTPAIRMKMTTFVKGCSRDVSPTRWSEKRRWECVCVWSRLWKLNWQKAPSRTGLEKEGNGHSYASPPWADREEGGAEGSVTPARSSAVRLGLGAFAGDPAVRHSLHPKWTSQERSNFVRRWGDASPWWTPHRPAGSCHFPKKIRVTSQGGWGDLSPIPSRVERGCPSTRPSLCSYSHLLCLWSPLLQALDPSEWETPMGPGDVWACGRGLAPFHIVSWAPTTGQALWSRVIYLPPWILALSSIKWGWY